MKEIKKEESKMKPMMGLATGVIAMALAVAAHAAPVHKTGDAKGGKGLTNSKKVMLSLRERDKKIRAVQKQARKARQQQVTSK